MSQTNLFSRLAGYSQNPGKRSIENFCTELLAHFFNNELVFRRRFLEVIFDDQRMSRPFREAQASTQESLGRGCRVDLVLRAGSKVHLIEVKITATETLSGRWGEGEKPQVQRYIDLRLGHVTYLTTRASLAPETDHRGRKFRMIKHALFEDLYTALQVKHLSPLSKLFLEFMEENNMSAPRPFNRGELKRAEDSLKLFQKCLSTLQIVRTEVNMQFSRNLNTRAELTRPTFTGGATWSEVHCYLAGYRGRRPVQWVGLSLSPDEDELYFHVWMWGKLDPTIGKIREHLGWYKYDDERLCTLPLRLNGTANDIPRMVNHALVASKKLGRAIARFV